MKVKVVVTTTMEYVAVVDAPDEVSAVQTAMLDALLQDSYDYGGQTAAWEVMPDAEPVQPDLAKRSRVAVIKHAVEQLKSKEPDAPSAG